MKVVRLFIQLTSICLLHAGVFSIDIPVFPDLDIEKLAGTWHPIEVVLKKRGAEGDLALKLSKIKEEICQMINFDVEEVSPGVFQVPGTSETILVVDTDYENYQIIHFEQNNICSLYLSGRTKEVSDDVKTKYRTLATTLEFDVDQIIDINLAGKSVFGGMFKEYTTGIISIMVLQLTLTATSSD